MATNTYDYEDPFQFNVYDGTGWPGEDRLLPEQPEASVLYPGRQFEGIFAPEMWGHREWRRFHTAITTAPGKIIVLDIERFERV